MKRNIMAMLIALPLGALSLLPKSASAAEVYSQYNTRHEAPIVVAQRQEYRYRSHRRVWVAGHWERNRYGRRFWVPGHWVYRR